MEGGNLDLVLQTGGETSSGEATVTNFALRDEPAFRQLVAAAPVAGPGSRRRRAARALREGDDRVRASPGALDIKDAVIYNPYMGLTTEGTVDFARNAIDVSGTFVPAYAVNTLLGKIPLVGVLLRRRQERGPVRHLVPGAGAVERPEADDQSAVGDRAGNPAQDSGRRRRHGRQVLVRRGGGGAYVAFGAFALALTAPEERRLPCGSARQDPG